MLVFISVHGMLAKLIIPIAFLYYLIRHFLLSFLTIGITVGQNSFNMEASFRMLISWIF